MAAFKPKFWKPGTEGPGIGLSQERSFEQNVLAVNTNLSLSIEQQRQRLPVFQHRRSILYMTEVYRTVIIIGETGSGKTTQIPQYLLEAGWGADKHCIAVTQPRRVACVSVATRVAEERFSVLGDEIGYSIRFDDVWDEEATRLKFLTDGMLVREMMKDPLLSKYSVIMLDEAHERSLHTDIVLGLLKKVQKRREDLRLIVTSATLDALLFKDFFETNQTSDSSKDTAAILTVEGRSYPVDVHYTLSPVPDYVKATAETILKIHKTQDPGDVLAFMTGMDEVEQVVRLLIEEAKQLKKNEMQMRIMPMHGSLPHSEQMKVFERSNRNHRKIIIATNIAETSITIPGIIYVVDCGFVKLKAFNPKTRIESLVIIPISKASADQRSGRAGRIRSGKAYRLYTEEGFESLQESTVPEMQRTNMAPVILQLKALGIENILRFNFLSPPPAENMVQGLELLYALEALDDYCQLTNPLGLQMAEFPLDPMYSKMLLCSAEFDCSEEALIIGAMMQIRSIFDTPSGQKRLADRQRRKFSVEEGDHLTMLNVYWAFIENGKKKSWCRENFLNYQGLMRAVEIRNQLKTILKRFNIPLVSCQGDDRAIRKCITKGFFANAARLHYTGTYRTVRDDFPLDVHPTSVLYVEKRPEWVVFNEVHQTSKCFMRDITVIESTWLHELAPHYYDCGTERELAAKKMKLDPV